MLKSQVFQYYTEKLWEKIKTTFMSKNDAINGVILDYKWKLVKSSINDVSIFLPSLDEIDEIYIEMSSPDSVILHQVTVKKDGLIPVGSNATSKEILLDGVFDYQTYVTYDVATNKITPSVFEGVTIDSTTSITTSVYVKEHIESDITVPAGSIAYDNVTSGMVSDDVQGAIDELKSDVSNITLDAEHTSYDNSTSGLSATNVQGAIDELKSENGFSLTSTLTAGQTSLTFTDARITTESTLADVYTSKFGVGISSAEITDGSLVVTFNTQGEDLTIKVVIM